MHYPKDICTYNIEYRKSFKTLSYYHISRGSFPSYYIYLFVLQKKKTFRKLVYLLKYLHFFLLFIKAKEEEEERKAIEEAERLAAEARRAEEQRLQKAIEEAQKREEEERKKKVNK